MEIEKKHAATPSSPQDYVSVNKHQTRQTNCLMINTMLRLLEATPRQDIEMGKAKK